MKWGHKALGVVALSIGLAWPHTAVAAPLADAPADLCATVGENAGFTRTGTLVTAVAIALAESGCNPSATGHNTNGTIDRGLWQINSIHTQFSNACTYDPQCNANAAYAIYLGRNSTFQPWVTYKTGKYRQYLDRAQAAVDRLGTPPTPRDRSEGDITGDGYADLTTVTAEGRLAVFGNGILVPGNNGVPYHGVSWQTDNTNWSQDAKSITTADVTGDRFADFLVLTSSGALQIYGNQSLINADHAPFTGVWRQYDNWSGYRKIAAGDINQDGFADLAAVTTSGKLEVFLNTKQVGDGQSPFSGPLKVYESGWGADVIDIALGDVTGDGYADLAAIRANGTLEVYGNGILLPGRGDTPFWDVTWQVTSGWNTVHDISLSDVTGDGFADLTAITSSGELQVYGNVIGHTKTDYYTGAHWRYPTWSGVHHVA
ncbi:FG-GAP-like repeat-containing protein [Saccharothrix obliqua]|uniref:FG-GAP-like repeat-containing protein n=1 Tax=Saccharothrix obliqua TaxID=2861747 RepID=UPI001C5FF732|nr:FG-GAP-like repeat-containing protein [Saccharothrix obliqua]MBW4717285.1 VCBS repeat-containing protein [Saccharothrix obliqua]